MKKEILRVVSTDYELSTGKNVKFMVGDSELLGVHEFSIDPIGGDDFVVVNLKVAVRFGDK